MLTSHYSAALVGSTVTETVSEYSPRSTSGAPETVATTWKDRVEYLRYDFEGPPAMVRHYEVTVISYVGRVVETYSRCERIMSDVWDDVYYAVVLADDGTFETVALGCSFDSSKGGSVDAGPELSAKYAEHKALAAEWARRTEIRRAAKTRREEARAEAKLPKKGRKVVVVKGRKVPKGTTGEVFWYGEGKSYNHYGSAPMRVGFKDGSGNTFFTAAGNVAVKAA